MIPSDWSFGLLGGLMIGSAAARFLLINGRIMGASGILGGLLDGSGWSNALERLAFLMGLIGAPALMLVFATSPETHAAPSPLLLIIAGLLVGFGTRLANGCTSGHGVCGISRLSLRGIVATAAYLAAGVLTMAIARHGLGWI